MLRTSLTALIAASMIAASIQGAVTITIDNGIDTPGLPGFRTFTVTATSGGAPIQGFDFVGDPTAPVDPATSHGFFGQMNQVTLFDGALSTIWTDHDAIIDLQPGLNRNQDSNFLFNSSSLLIIPGSARETATSLQAAFSTTTNFGQTVPFAQIVVPATAVAIPIFRGVVGTTDGAEFPVSGYVVPPITPVITPVDLGEIDHSTTIQANLQASGPHVWSGLTLVEGSPAIPATLTSTGAFAWDPTGSKRGPKGNGVRYSWSATVTGPFNSTTGLALTLRLIPEPTTLVLIGMMATCFHCSGSRSRFRDNRFDAMFPCGG
jgi:hypothetical protein